MKFTTTTALLSGLSGALAADGIFSITGTGQTGSPSTVSLQVLNGVVGEAPKCSGTALTTPLPGSGTIPCVQGYALTFHWNSIHEGISATYTNPTNTFTYNVPNNGCDANNLCQFGFTNNFPGRKARALRV
ncbi:hypothetical protein VTL71DRAFT_8410 [Oculimacula yallundae]|uniref:Uncharacterized protein n=1 Tax=Oculimacula yallundae TaxID=86028 RepID=A0ABR4CXQ5_9HELO